MAAVRNVLYITVYSFVNSDSMMANRPNSWLSSNDVKMGSLLDKAIREGDDSAL